MGRVRLPNSGTVITDSDRELHIVIPVHKEYLLIIACVLALLPFGVGVLALLIEAPNILDDSTQPFWLFILFLIVLIATDALLIGLMLWNLTGKRIIYVNSINMILRHKMLGYARERKFDLEKIHNLRVGNFKETASLGSAADRMDDETFIASLENYSVDSMIRETFYERLIQVDITKLHKLRFSDLKTPKDPLAPYRFSAGFCSGILFDYDTKRYEFGVSVINGAEAEQVVDIITQRYRILGSKKD